MNAITFNRVTKEFRLLHDASFSLSKQVDRLIKRTAGWFTGASANAEKFVALREISFDIKHGESVGIIGPNGSGKTTILRLIANITKPSRGTIQTHGRIAPLIELGAGFHPELTGRENIFLNGAILGMSKKTVKSKFDEIVSFAELEQFIDAPIKQYSAGMVMRLGFAVAIHSDFDTLLADEVLAVGDQRFQEKCRTMFEKIKTRNKTLILISHSIDLIRQFCNRGVLLESGIIIKDESADTVCNDYEKRHHNY